MSSRVHCRTMLDLPDVAGSNERSDSLLKASTSFGSVYTSGFHFANMSSNRGSCWMRCCLAWSMSQVSWPGRTVAAVDETDVVVGPGKGGSTANAGMATLSADGAGSTDALSLFVVALFFLAGGGDGSEVETTWVEEVELVGSVVDESGRFSRDDERPPAGK